MIDENENRGSGITTAALMKRLKEGAAASYTKALEQAGVKGASKATSEESFKAGMNTMLHHLKELGVVVLVADPKESS